MDFFSNAMFLLICASLIRLIKEVWDPCVRLLVWKLVIDLIQHKSRNMKKNGALSSCGVHGERETQARIWIPNRFFNPSHVSYRVFHQILNLFFIFILKMVIYTHVWSANRMVAWWTELPLLIWGSQIHCWLKFPTRFWGKVLENAVTDRKYRPITKTLDIT